MLTVVDSGFLMMTFKIQFIIANKEKHVFFYENGKLKISLVVGDSG